MNDHRRPGWTSRAAATLGRILAMLAMAAQAPTDAPTVGMAGQIRQLVLPGSELEAKPIESRDAAIVVRVRDVYRHGDAFRYDLEYYGLEPGEFDLRDSLRRKDGSTTADLPPIPVTIRAILPPGQVLPHEIETGGAPAVGGYKLWMLLGLIAWSIGLVLIGWRGRRRRIEARRAGERPETLADRLRPLVEAATAGSLEAERLAELERLLIGYWRRRLGLEGERPARASAALREHPEAGPLIVQLEDWLHRPGEAGPVDVAALLAPYRDLPPEALDATADEVQPQPAGGAP